MNKIILSFDNLIYDDIIRYALLFKDEVYAIKLYDAILKYGMSIIHQLHNYNIRIIADCNLYNNHDEITNNVNMMFNWGTDIITIHPQSFYVPSSEISDKLITNTVLSCVSEREWQTMYDVDLCECVLRYSEFAVKHNYGYIICNPYDLKKKMMHKLISNNNIKVICSGIDINNNQLTPKTAFSLGADYIILNSSILSLSFEKIIRLFYDVSLNNL